MHGEKTLTIGQLARSAGVNTETIRYYERIGLFRPTARSASGYRHYSIEQTHRLHFIRRAQQLGFSLDEIGELLRLVDRNGDRAEVRRLARQRLTDVEQRLVRMTQLRDTLKQLVDTCNDKGTVADCPIIEAVTGNYTHKKQRLNDKDEP